jgi:hypothetical protein
MTPRERRSQTGSFARSFGAIRYGADYGRWYRLDMDQESKRKNALVSKNQWEHGHES